MTELGELLSAFGHGALRPIEYVHDPNKGGPMESQIMKRLSLQPLGNDGSIMANLSVTEKGTAARISVPISAAELEVLCVVARFVIPRALGFDLMI